VAEVMQHATRNLIFTGGEPMLHQRHIRAICAAVRPAFVEIETNGTIASEIDDIVDQFNISPKLDFSNPVVLPPGEKAWFKFVIRDAADIRAMDAFCAEHKVLPERLVLQPEGITREQILGRIDLVITAAAERGAMVSPRVHILLWNDKRAV